MAEIDSRDVGLKLIETHIVAGFIHRPLCEQMVAYATAIAPALQANVSGVTWVPGSLEAPFAVSEIIATRRPDAIVVFGVQAAGQTKHGEVVATVATSKLVELQIAHRMPMAIAIIGPNASLEHAAGKTQYVAEKAMRAAIHMARLLITSP